MAQSPASDASHDNDSPVAESSTGGGGGAAQNKTPAVKDKECPYCHQPFTSSSLGRHLDQYIKKKKPDGIHVVEEIRRLRGGITRRTARHGSSARNDHEEDASQSPSANPAAPPPPAEIDRLNVTPIGGVGTRLNTPNWQSTGVINGLSDLPSALITGPTVSTPTGTKRTWSTYEQAAQREVTSSRGDLGSEKDTARAVELALREVLDVLQAATTRTQCRSTPFDFELESQTFPSLCLRILPLPPTLSSAQPFDSPTSLSLGPPGSMHIDPLRLRMRYQIEVWKWECLRAAKKWTFPTPTAQNLGDEQDNLSIAANEHEDFAMKHLELAYGSWMSCSEHQRQHLWQIELMRAFAREREVKQKLEAQLERVEQEASQLQAQVNYLSRCQWPREMALWPPDRTPIGKEVTKELKGGRMGGVFGVGGTSEVGDSNSTSNAADSEQRWDYSRVVNKWRKIVREDTLRKTGIVNAGVGGGGGPKQQDTPSSPATATAAFTPTIPSNQFDNPKLSAFPSSSTGTPASSASGAAASTVPLPPSQNKRTKLGVTSMSMNTPTPNGTSNNSNNNHNHPPPPPLPPSSVSPTSTTQVMPQDNNNNKNDSSRRKSARQSTSTASHVGMGMGMGTGGRAGDQDEEEVGGREFNHGGGGGGGGGVGKRWEVLK